MAPTPLKRLTALQNARMAEMERMRARLGERPVDSLNKNIVDSRIKALNKIWSEARTTHGDIVIRIDAEADPYTIDNIFPRLQNTYEDFLDELLTILSRFESNVDPPVFPIPNSNETSIDRLDTAKLPKLNLPKFSGNYEDWESFSDLFISLVHSKKATDATKLSYLKLCLTGTAADLVKDVATTDSNYLTTWQALKQRFYNPRLIVNNHLNALMNMTALKKESAIDLRAFADEAQRIVRALNNLKMPVEHWNIWFTHILSAKLDPDSRKAWESELSARDRVANLNIVGSSSSSTADSEPLHHFPKFSEFAEFLEKRSQTLNMIALENIVDKKSLANSKPMHSSRKIFHVQQGLKSFAKCALCAGSHQLWKCYKLKAKSPYDRRSEIRRLNLCFNCFGHHKHNVCNSKGRCSTCKEKHHTLLHFDLKRTPNSPRSQTDFGKKPDVDSNMPARNVTSLTASVIKPKHTIILATAQVTIQGPNGNQTRVRALLDQGSEATFVTEAIVQLLGLPKRSVNISLSCIGENPSGRVHAVTSLNLRSIINPDFIINLNPLVLSRLTSHLPAQSVMELDLTQYTGIALADPQFHIRDPIDMILGADVYGKLLRSGLRSFSDSSLIAQETALGWILSGPIPTNLARRAEYSFDTSMQVLHCIAANDLDNTLQLFWNIEKLQVDEAKHIHSESSQVHSLRRAANPFDTTLQTLYCVAENDLNESLQRFWNLEELPDSTHKLNPEDESCEKLFRESHTRNSDGRYVVRLPWKCEPPVVAVESRRIALGSHTHLHHKFSRESKLAEAYRDFMTKYEQLGHMERVPVSEINNNKSWYLPHHAVVQRIQSAIKIRVVFDASRQTYEKHSLNKFLLSGPALQTDLALILLNWRTYRYVFTADIIKMFRQIRVASDDQDYQRILWSPNVNDAPVDYRLTTVTYGTACAPYLAIRTLLQLAQDERSRFPLGAQCLEKYTYVDDIFAGADDISTAVSKRVDVIEILKSAGIELDKWAANHEDLLPPHLKSTHTNVEKQINKDEVVKTLGILWNPKRDVFTFKTIDFEILANATTKRSVLSNIARLFDPLGWLSPITVIAKILMQDLWILKYDWDTPLPGIMRDRWINYCRSLESLSALTVDRWMGTASGQTCQLHAFSDASSRAYAASVYLRVSDGNGNLRISLLAAKTKVAPVKTVSIPNLELCGAVLLVKLIRHLQNSEFFKNLPIYAWSDSQVVINWLRKHPRTWKTFVANRVSFIQTELSTAIWAYVPTKENPADLATRGSTPLELMNSNLWWHGPSWLTLSNEKWPQVLTSTQNFHSKITPTEPDILTRFSSFTRLIRVIAYCLRPLVRLRRVKYNISTLPPFLTSDELTRARFAAIKLAQSAAFATEINILKSGKLLPKRNTLSKLFPKLDEDGILRVGGRLAHSMLSSDQKNPPILPHYSVLSQLIIRKAHRSCLHGGPTLTANIVNQQAWILGRKRLIKSVIHNCTLCQRVKPKLSHQLMGDLPAARVTPARPFSSAGLDYAGPIQVRTTKGRGHKSYKGYIVLFICFATRAIHLELVSDCTSSTFIAAYRRFVSRRGICHKLYSDNATTFHGADKELKNMFTAASEFYKTTAALIANDGTDWIFIPPNAPHYGGLWEAGVKATKHHLKRTIGEHTLTFEELYTLLTEIEVCLNSRPLCPMSTDTDDLHVLTPAHFLIGETSALIPDEEPPTVPENRLSRFQLVQRIRNNFWQRWSKEYLQHLQERAKWKGPTENFAVGQLVIIMDDRYPPAKWPLGRIIKIHPGPDNLVRVVTIKTSTTSLKRHISRLCPLRLDENVTNSRKESCHNN